MSPEQHKILLHEAVKGDEDAINFLLVLGKTFRIWDDLWDRDREVSKEDADQVFVSMCFNLSRNSFFRKHRDILEAQIMISWNAWSDANAWEHSSKEVERKCAWHIRDYCNEIVQLCAWLIGGIDHVRNISLKIRSAYLQELIEGDT